MGVRRSRVTGLGANGLASESISIDQRGNATTNRVWRNRASAEEIAWVKYPTSTTPAVTTSTNGLVRSSVSQTGVTTTFAYDAFQREVSQTDGRGNTTRTAYDSLGRVASTIDARGYATIYGYDALGRQTSVTDPLTNTVTTAYDADGRVVSQRGATYPVDYFYDEFGDKISMITYRDINAAGDVTRWLRDEATGLVTNKVYADGKGPRYDYTPDGKLATRTWARGIVTTYSYDDNGSLTNTVYSDGTPTISIVYNRAGQQIEAHDAAGVTTFLYDDFGAVTNETVLSVAGTNVIERYYDSVGRSLGYSLNGVRQSTLAYDPATGRLASMLANGSDTPFTWNYLAGSDLKSSLAYPNGLTASWQYDANNQLLQVKNAFPTNTISQYDYACDAGGRRVEVSKSGSVFTQDDTIAYGYNEKSELTNAVAAVDSDYRYAYDFDQIGNRESSSERGTNSVYTANNLNQYTAVDDFTPQFDDDGNQTLIKTATGIWSVTYNGENRPILWGCLQSNNQAVTNDQTISMSFDRMGRRVAKNTQRFVYDGYLQIANFEHSTSNIELQTFIWDPTEPVATRPFVWNRASVVSYYTHDGYKNISEVVCSDGIIYVHYEYAPFGALAVAMGECAFSNPWRFSCECADDDIAMVYYNYRHYEPNVGRWSVRDADEGLGVLNLYLWLNNDISDIDVGGLSPLTDALSKYFNPMSVGSFSKDIIRFPLGSGFVVLTVSVNISMYDCCSADDNVKQEWVSADLTAELYYQMGMNINYPPNRKVSKLRREQGFDKKARKKGQMMPHPCEPGRMINIANYNKEASRCRKKSRRTKPGATGGGNVRLCPTNEGWGVGGGFFIRASAGVGLGVIVDGRVDMWALIHDNKGLESLSGSAQAGWVIGASVDIGGWGSAWWEHRIR